MITRLSPLGMDLLDSLESGPSREVEWLAYDCGCSYPAACKQITYLHGEGYVVSAVPASAGSAGQGRGRTSARWQITEAGLGALADARAQDREPGVPVSVTRRRAIAAGRAPGVSEVACG